MFNPFGLPFQEGEPRLQDGEDLIVTQLLQQSLDFHAKPIIYRRLGKPNTATNITRGRKCILLMSNPQDVSFTFTIQSSQHL